MTRFEIYCALPSCFTWSRLPTTVSRLLRSTRPATSEQRQQRLWATYIFRMFEQRPLNPSIGYTTEHAIDWLTWLAREMHDRDCTEFHLDRLTADWLPTQGGMHFKERWLFRIAASRARPAEELHWSWNKIMHRPRRATIASMLCVLAIAITCWLMIPIWRASVILVVAMYGIMNLASSGISAELCDKRTEPNEGIKLAARHAITSGLLFGIFGGMVFVQILILVQEAVFQVAWNLIGKPGSHQFLGVFVFLSFGGPVGWLSVVIAVAVTIGVASGQAYGGKAWLRHYAIRVLLMRAGVAPWRYERFLEAMAERILLRRSGSSFLFTHGLLSDYLAERKPGSALSAEPPVGAQETQ